MRIVEAKPTGERRPAANAGACVGVLGAGSSGLAVARRLQAAGISFECLERQDQLGGNWCYGTPASSVYRSTHLISSKRLTEYPDFPMPDSYPDYPGHRQVWEYLRSYADHHDLDRHIR
ncbi:MAG: NAD(P)-binding protein, partial [Planctomycetota bacterium]